MMFVDEEHLDRYSGDGWITKEETEGEKVVCVTKQQIENLLMVKIWH